MKPGDLYVGVVDLFAVLLPGAILTTFLSTTSLVTEMQQAGLLPRFDASGVGWVVFWLAAYALGHFIFLLASPLDGLYDVYRKRRWKNEAAYQQAKALRDRRLDGVATPESLNPFSWAKSVLMLRHPNVAADVHRYEADSKFFRSFFFLLLVLAAAMFVKQLPWLATGCLVVAVPTFLRYAERRHKSTEWAYRHIITLAGEAAAKSTGEATSSKPASESAKP